MIYQTIINKYKQREEQFSDQLQTTKKKIRQTAFLRGIVFLTGCILGFIFYKVSLTGFITGIIGFSVLFAYLIRKFQKLQTASVHLAQLVTINQNELLAFEGNYSQFDGGREFNDFNHPYIYDLDIFGEGSVFQYINRTGTYMGKTKLADWLKNPLLSATTIIERQQAVKELSPKIDWRQDFNVTGNILGQTTHNKDRQWNIEENPIAKDKNDIIKWLDAAPVFATNRIMCILLVVFPAIALVLLLLFIVDVLPFNAFFIFSLIQFGIVGANLKKINYIHQQVSKKEKALSRFAMLLKLIENEEFSSPLLQQLKSALLKNSKTAGQNLKSLAGIVKALDNRLNLLFSFISNSVVLYDLQTVVRLEKWRLQFKDEFRKWFEVISEFDSFSSLATFSYNHPDYVFPNPVDNTYTFDLKQGGHPLLHRKERVNNSFNIDKYGFVAIVTGANMAGKSTFLRTIGTNMVLAMTGSVVCAKEFLFTPIDIYTSIRTDDSLQKHESYFYAELKRLKTIIDELTNKRKLFVIIDEMLRGTNSRDKHAGSKALIEQLIRLEAVGIVATHDIGLGNLKDEYPENVRNQRFEVEIKDDKLFFDYTLKEGISQNLNATFLMRKMGITL